MYYNRARMTLVWGLLAAAALLWPDRISGPFDGVPLDRVAEAIAAAVVFPILWWLHPRFLTTRIARAAIVLLIVWKACATAIFVQDGWCVRFVPSRPYFKDARGAPHAWDLRADWRSPDPACSAIMTRSYHELSEFPAWFFNLPPDNESWPIAADRPPGARVAMTVQGFLHARAAGVLNIETGPDVAASISVDGHAVDGSVPLAAGIHSVFMDSVLTGDRWSLVPTWNGEELWSAVTTTVGRPSSLDLFVRPWVRLVPSTIVVVLLSSWAITAAMWIGDPIVLLWSALSSGIIGWLVLSDRAPIARAVIPALLLAAWLPVPPRLRNRRGAFLLVGIPWLTYAAACASTAIGRFVFYGSGHDTWMLQRFAYRIVMQGYWLEGGAPTFWFQAGYRWIAGAIHALFGDSSAGEWVWDSACLLAGSLFAFRATRSFAGFRWAITAAVLPLAVFIVGTPFYLIGYGLSEISSAGFVYAAALFAMRARNGSLRAAIAAGVLGLLAFFVRLNNLLMALGVVAFALPPRMPAGLAFRVRAWWARVSWRTVAGVVATIGCGLLLFAWRTWYYTGVFSVFYGTQRQRVAIWSLAPSLGGGLAETVKSVLVVLTVNEPPRFDPYSLPVPIGAAVAVLAVARTPRLREVPLPLALFFFAGIASAFIAHGWFYPGRFSVHIIPVTCALTICALARTARIISADGGRDGECDEPDRRAPRGGVDRASAKDRGQDRQPGESDD